MTCRDNSPETARRQSRNVGFIYDPTTDTWSAAGTKLRGDATDEESWVKLPDGSVLSYDIFSSISSGVGHAQRYIPASDTWVDAGTVPVDLTSPSLGYELGPALLLPDGRVFQIGANSNTAFYTPTTNTWTAGPVIPGGMGADDAPAAILPNGHVILAADVPLFNAPTQLFDFDPVANTITPMTLPADLSTVVNNQPAYVERMLMLPSGDLLFTDGNNQLWDYNANEGPTAGSQPTISSIVPDGGSNYTLTGTQLNGISEGANYGDDAQMSSNYPIVELTDGSGTVTFARTFDWTSEVATGATPVTTQFTLPAGIPGGLYSLRVIANGIPSDPVSFDVPLAVIGSNPADGAGVSTPPTSFVITFNEAVEPGSLQASDLLVNGIGATGVSLDATMTVATFTYGSSPVTAQGLQSMTIADSAITGQDGSGNTAFSASFRYDAVLLKVTSTSPATPNGVFTLPGPFTYNVNFNEAIDPATVQTSDLVLSGFPGATVTGVTVLAGNTTAQFTLSGITTEGTLNTSIAAGAINDAFDNPGFAAFHGTYQVDIGTVPFPGPLMAEQPLGSLIYDSSASGRISPAGDTDTFTLDVDPGQKISVLIDPNTPNETLYGGIGNGSGTLAGDLIAINPATGSGTFVGDPVTPGGLTGLVYDPSTGVFFGSTIQGFGSTSKLVRIDPDTGALLGTIGSITDGSGGPAISIGDLAIQPGTNVIFGVRSNPDGGGGGGLLYTINKTTGVATLIGNTGGGANGGLAFAPDGSLYQTGFDSNFDFASLNQIDPTNAARISTVGLSDYLDGLAIRSDGAFFATTGQGNDGIYLLDPTTGAETLIGETGQGSSSDLAFRPGNALIPSVQLLDPSDAVIATATATSSGMAALVQTVPTGTGGTYKIVVSGASSTTGSYTAQVVLNSALENEAHGGPRDDTLATAQDLSPSSVSLGSGADRLAVLGTGGQTFYGVDRGSGVLREYDVNTGALQGSLYMTVGGSVVTAAYGLAVDPTTHVVYALVSYPGVNTELVTLDVATGEGTAIADVNAAGQRFTDMAFDSAGQLYGLTGDGGANSASLFALDKSTGARTFLTALPNGGGATGESLAYNPDNGLLYRFQAGTFESIDPNNGFADTTIPTSGSNPYYSQALTYVGGGQFRLASFASLYSITTAGELTFLGSLASDSGKIQGLVLTGDATGYYSFTLAAHQTATLAMAGAGSTVELLDSSGTVLASGVAAENVSQVISNFTATAAGTYYARVTLAAPGAYSLLVTRGAAFDTEANNDLASAQALSGNTAALGALTGASSQAYATGDNGNYLISINTTTGVGTYIGPFGYADAYAGASTPDGTFYTIINGFDSSSSDLATVDLATGAATIVGPLNGPGDPIITLEADAAGNLYTGDWNGEFYSVNKTTGQVMPIGPMGLFNIMDLSFDNSGTLWALDGANNLFTVDTTTGAGTYVSTITGAGPVGDAMGLLVDPTDGSFYCTTYTSSSVLYHLDPTTGVAIPIGSGLGIYYAHGGDFQALPGDSDWYSISVNAGDALSISTGTPAGDPQEPFEIHNQLDPAVELYDSAGNLVAANDNGGADGKNASLTYTALTSGTYYVRVLSTNDTAGEYVLNVAGATGALPSFHVTAVSPQDGFQTRTPPTQVTVDFNDSVLLTTLQADDLTVDGVAASGFTVDSGTEVTFYISAPTDGVHTIHIAAGAIEDLQGTPLDEFTSHYSIDLTPPRVTATSLALNGVAAPGSLTYQVTFSEAMLTSNLSADDFALQGNFRGGNYFATSFSFNAAGTVLTLNYTNLPDDNYTLTLFAGVSGGLNFTDAFGNALDGEFSGTFPSGDGTAGGDFVTYFSLDLVTEAYPTPLAPVAPSGSLIYDSTITRVINFAGDTDSFTLNVDPGQTITVVVQSASIQGTIRLYDPLNNLVGSASAPGIGQDAVLQLVPVGAGGIYKVTIGDASGSTGLYTAQVILNAAVENESHGGPTNDTIATAQNIDASFESFVAGAPQRGAVLGHDAGKSLYGVDRLSNLLLAYDPGTGAVRSSTPMTVNGNSVTAGYGLAIDPTTGGLYALVSYSGVNIALVTLDPTSGVGTYIADIAASGQHFTDIAFASSGQLYGLTGDGGANSASLFAINKANGAQTLLLALTNSGGGTGESLAFNSDTGLLYRFQAGTFQSIDPVSLAVVTIPTSGPNPYQSQALTYAGHGQFFLVRFDDLYSLTTSGTLTYITHVSSASATQGLALLGNTADVYSFTLAANQSVTLALSGAGSTLELLNSSGTVLATGSAAGNLSAVINNYHAVTGGLYYARTSGVLAGDYTLVVTRDADFDTESNDTAATAQNITGTHGALGYVNSGASGSLFNLTGPVVSGPLVLSGSKITLGFNADGSFITAPGGIGIQSVFQKCPCVHYLSE